MIKQALKETIVYTWYDYIRTKVRNTYYLLTPTKVVINKEYRKVFGKEMNWDKPRDLNEKINWLKLYSDTSQWTLLADKYAVREYVKSKGFEDILVPLYGKWNTPPCIELITNNLPESFVLKTNHGSNDTIIVQDKSKIDAKLIQKKLKRAYKAKFGYQKGEPHYLSIKPCIIAEKYLEQRNDPWTTSLVDYKIWCFNGKPAYIWACYSRSKEAVYVETRDLDWNYHPEKSVFTSHYRDGKGTVPRPKCLERMIEVSSKLSEGFPQVRVDLYEIDGKIYFGEMTFTSNGGYNDFYTQDFLNELGDLIKL